MCLTIIHGQWLALPLPQPLVVRGRSLRMNATLQEQAVRVELLSATNCAKHRAILASHQQRKKEARKKMKYQVHQAKIEKMKHHGKPGKKEEGEEKEDDIASLAATMEMVAPVPRDLALVIHKK
jgi:hypothetical protein